MALQMSLQQACAAALGAYLTTELVGVPGSIPPIFVRDRWPEPSTLHKNPKTTCSVITVGPPKLTYVEPHVVNQVNIDAAHASYTWGVAFMDQMLSLEIEATSDRDRDDLNARLFSSLHRGFVGSTTNAAEDLVLTLGNGWLGTAVYTFEGPENHDGVDLKTLAYAASFRGNVSAVYTVTATSARMATIIARDALSKVGSTAVTTWTTTVNAAGGTITKT